MAWRRAWLDQEATHRLEDRPAECPDRRVPGTSWPQRVPAWSQDVEGQQVGGEVDGRCAQSAMKTQYAAALSWTPADGRETGQHGTSDHGHRDGARAAATRAAPGGTRPASFRRGTPHMMALAAAEGW